MAGRIPKAFIDELIARADIVEVVGAPRHAEARGQQLQRALPFSRRENAFVYREPVEGVLPLLRLQRPRHGAWLPDGLRQPRISRGRRSARRDDGARSTAREHRRTRAQGRQRRALRPAARSRPDLSCRAAHERNSDRVLEETRHRRATAGRFGIGYAPTPGIRCCGNSAPRTRASPSSCRPGSSSRTTRAAATTAFAIASCSRFATRRAARSSASAAACSTPASRNI